MDKTMKNKIFMTALTQLAINYNAQFSKELMSFWLSLLEDENPEIVVKACREVAKNYEYKTLPPFAVLNNEIKKIKAQDTESIDARASAAWNNLLALISKNGAYREPELDAKTAYAVRCLGGWQVCCQWTENTLNFRQRDFIELWKQAETKGDIIAQALPNSELAKMLADKKVIKAIE